MIFNHKKNQGYLEGIQLVRFGNDLVVAIKRAQEQDMALSGNFGEISIAHPVTSSGEINRNVKLTVKFLKDTERTLIESDVEEPILKEAHTKYDEDSGQKIDIPAVTANSHKVRNEAAVAETMADQKVFSARTTRIPTSKKIDGKTVYETAILMSTVQGVSLDKFNFFALTKEQRLRLAINVIKAYEELHSKGVFHRDIKLNNIMVNPETLDVIPIDLDNSVSSTFIRAPQDKGRSDYIPTPESEIYSLAQDILPSILSGTRHMRKEDHYADTIGNNIASGINTKFSGFTPPQDKENNISKSLKGILNKMRSSKPENRGTLKEAREELKKQLKAVTKDVEQDSNSAAVEQHKESIRQLDSVLQSPEYKIRNEYVMSDIDSVYNSIDNAYASTVTETIFRLEELASKMICSATKIIDENGNKLVAEIPEDTIKEYNHHQRQLAVLMKKDTYPTLEITTETISVATLSTETKKPAQTPVKSTKTESIYFLAETLQGTRNAAEPKNSDKLDKPARAKSYPGNGLTRQEKCSAMNGFKKEFDAFFENKKNDFISSITSIFEKIELVLTNAPKDILRNPSGFFYHPNDNSSPIKPENGHGLKSN